MELLSIDKTVEVLLQTKQPQ